MPVRNTKRSDRFSGIGAPEPRLGRTPAWIAAGQRVGISTSLSKPLPLKCRRGDRTGAIVRRSIRKPRRIGNGSRNPDLSAVRQLAGRGPTPLAGGLAKGGRL